MGGFSIRGGCRNSVELYDPEKNEWSILTPLLQPRCNFQTATVDDFVYVFGGQRNLLLTTVERYTIEDDSWTKVNKFVLEIA